MYTFVKKLKTMANKKKKPFNVTFNEDSNEIYYLLDEDKEENNYRKIFWELVAIDRSRFKDKVNRMEKIIGPILKKEHRMLVMNKYYNL